MHIFDWLQQLESLNHLNHETLWFLVQKPAICVLEVGKFTHGFCIVLDGVAQIQEHVSSEKPSQTQVFEAPRGALIPPDSQVVVAVVLRILIDYSI